jgi:plastocyanin
MTSRRLLRPLAAPVAALSLVLALAACGNDDSTPSAKDTTATTKADQAANVVGADFTFTMPKGTVKAGSEVYFENKGPSDHTMTADDGSFDTKPVAAGKTAEFDAPTAPGTYTFHCSIHPSMTGTLTVQ